MSLKNFLNKEASFGSLFAISSAIIFISLVVTLLYLRFSGNNSLSENNSGNWNSGNYNSGDKNSGNWNSGGKNSGDGNSGDGNSGNYNSGSWNSGNFNSGNYNSGHYNSGFFCEETPTVRLFDKDTGLTREQISVPRIPLPLLEWVGWESMSEELRAKHPEALHTKGFLVQRTYKEAWAKAWSTMDKVVKEEFKNLPNFCPEKFKRITGIDVENEGKLRVEANGKVVYISKDSAIALGLIEEEDR